MERTTARLGLGLAALGRPAYITLGHADDLGADRSIDAVEAHAHAVLDAARAAGVTYVDAARSYGHAEAFLARWLASRGVAPGALFVASKWGYEYVGGWRLDAPKHEIKDHSLRALERQWAESRALLGAHLGLYQIHSATLDSGVLDDAAILDRLAQLRHEHGVAIGLSVSGPRQPDVIRRALAIAPSGARLFDAVQATWNLLEPSAGPALAEAHAAGVRVVVKEGVANGRLGPRHRGAEVAALTARAGALGASVDALALAAALAQPWASTVLSGAATLAQLASNVAAVELAARDDVRAALEDLTAELAEPPDVYWTKRAALAWT